LREADEKEVRAIIVELLGIPEGSPKFETLLNHWREHRQSHGWQIS
jgi:hypothetical protein